MVTLDATTARTRRVMHPMRPRTITVTGVREVARAYLRVSFSGEDLSDFVTPDPDDHVKLVFPASPDADPTLPVWGEQGFDWPEHTLRPPMRDYTPRRFDPRTRELDIDFVVHGAGVAADWAAQAKAGQRLGLLGPRGSLIVDGPFDWYLLAGDETVLPSIARRLEGLPAGASALAVIEIDGHDQAQDIPTAADVQLHWVSRDGRPAGTTPVLERALRGLSLPDGDGFAWVGGEATTLRGIRRHLLGERELRKEWTAFSGHWKLGVADHDHHEPIED